MKYPQRSQYSLHLRSLNRKLHTGQNSIGSCSEIAFFAASAVFV
jgi:hypothetical protein